MLVLFPLLAVGFYFDFSGFLTFLLSSPQASILVTAIALFAVGAFMKRRIIGARLEIAGTSYLWGVLLVVLASASYVGGAYVSGGVWLRLFSLYLFTLSYFAFTIGAGFEKGIAPLLAILGFGLLPVSLYSGIGGRIDTLVPFGLMMASFFIFAKGRLTKLLLPSAFVVLGLVASFFPTIHFSNVAVGAYFLIPIPLVGLVFQRTRDFALLPRTSRDVCQEHQLLPNGFCSICGFKGGRSEGDDNLGIFGLATVVAVILLLVFTNIPVLMFESGAPSDANVTANGTTFTSILHTPAGWEVNSSTRAKNNQSDVYALSQVLVPTFHPERENYTVFYSVALGFLNTSLPHGELLGWNRSSNVLTQFGPFQGYLTAYTSHGVTMLDIEGHGNMELINGSSFGQYTVDVGFLRQFKNLNMGADTAQFMSDVNSLWVPSLTQDVNRVVWTSFLSTMYGDFLSVYTFLVTVSTAGAVALVAIGARARDDRLDRFLSLSVIQPEYRWSYLSTLAQKLPRGATGRELAEASGVGVLNGAAVDKDLRSLESDHLIGRGLVERGADLVSVWLPVA